MFNDLLNESYIMNENDLYINFKDWKRKQGKNVLLITGLSGSGKSTLATKFAKKYNATVFHFDYVDFQKKYRDEEESGFLKKFYKKYPKYDIDNDQPMWKNLSVDDDYLDYVRDVFVNTVNEMCSHPDKLYIIEGLHLYAFLDHRVLYQFPIIIKGTSFLTTQYRRLMRDNDSNNILTNFITEIKNNGLGVFKVGLNDEIILNKLRSKLRESSDDIMFNDLLMEAAAQNINDESSFLPDKNGKIAIFEHLFKDDQIKKKICYGFSSSHEYDEKDKKIEAVKSCIRFVNNYEWTEKTIPTDSIESFDKPLNTKKVYNIAKTLEEKGNTEKLIVVDKIHGFNWQSRGKVILLDGNHRKGAISMMEIKDTDVYHGKYTGNGEIQHDEHIANHEKSLNESVEFMYDDNTMTITRELFETVSNIKNFFIESSNDYAIIQEAAKNKVKINKVSLTPSEEELVDQKYGKVECSFFKDSNSGKYFCMTHICRSKLYDSPTDIPKDEVRFVSSTS